MAHPNEQLLRSLYEAASRRDIPTIRGLFTDDVVFHQPDQNSTSGDYHGADGLLGLLGTLAERTDGTFRVTVHDVLGGDEHAVALLQVAAEREAAASTCQSSTSPTCATASWPRSGSTPGHARPRRVLGLGRAV